MSTTDFRIVAGQFIPALTVSLPFNCEINLDKIFKSTTSSHLIKIYTSQNGFLFCNQTTMNQLNDHWANAIEIARNCSEQNVSLNRLSGSNQLQLCTTRSINMNENLKLWPSHSLLNEWNIPDYLQLANFMGINQYKCIYCSKVYEEPNQLKVHIALSCNKSIVDQSAKCTDILSIESYKDNLTKDIQLKSNLLRDNQLTKQMCNNLLNHSYSNSLIHQSLKNSTTHLGFDPFNLFNSNSNSKKTQDLMIRNDDFNINFNFNLNDNSLNRLNHVLINHNNHSNLSIQDTSLTNLNNFNTLNNLNLSGLNNANMISHSLSNHNISSLISQNNMINKSNLISHNLMKSNYSNNYPPIKRRKLEENNDLISALSKLNESQRSNDLLLINKFNKNQTNQLNNLNESNTVNQLNNLNSLNGSLLNGTLNQMNDKLNGLNQLKTNKNSSNDINLIDSDLSSDATDEMLNDKVVTSSSMGLLNINNSTKNRTMKLTKEPRTHTCKFCKKLYTRKYGLKIHIRTHTGHKPLKCQHCQRRFSDPSNLNKHQRLHDQHKQWNKQIDVKT